VINEPVGIISDGFQRAWLEVIKLLISSHWDLRNLVVHIKNPTNLDQAFHHKVRAFTKEQGILSPKDVAYTIFPHNLYKSKGNSDRLFSAYNKPGGLFDRIKTGWGTYFRRMTNYEGVNGPVNQLANIISAIRNRQKLSKAAYTILIQNPGGETIRPLGGPCLNYLAVQAESKMAEQSLTLGLLAIYRNHDFLERAYGNYWGLCNLINFLAREVDGDAGPLTCISSHAYVSKRKKELRALVERI